MLKSSQANENDIQLLQKAAESESSNIINIEREVDGTCTTY